MQTEAMDQGEGKEREGREGKEGKGKKIIG